MTSTLTDKLNIVLDAHWYKESSRKLQPSILNSGLENHISITDKPTDKIKVNRKIKFDPPTLFPSGPSQRESLIHASWVWCRHSQAPDHIIRLLN